MSAVPSALKYERSIFDNDNGRPAFGSSLDQKAREIRRFDGRMHGRMSNATTRDEWSSITNDLIAASSEPFTEVGGLSDNVKKRFLEDCPEPELRKLLNQALHAKKNGVVRHEVHQRQSNTRQLADAKKAARSQRDRNERASKKTPSNGGGQQGKGKKGKH